MIGKITVGIKPWTARSVGQLQSYYPGFLVKLITYLSFMACKALVNDNQKYFVKSPKKCMS